MPGNGRGIPDGSTQRTIVVDHRQTVVLAPNGGLILFAVVPSQYGAVALGTGKASATLNAITPTGATQAQYGAPIGVSLSITATTAAPTPSIDAAIYPLLPFSESLVRGGLVGVPTLGGLQATHSRVITCTARVMYTGATLSDSGAATTCKLPMWTRDTQTLDAAQLGSHPYFKTGAPLPSAPPITFDAIAAVAGSRVFPARESCDMLSVPTDYEFEPIRDAMVPFVLQGTSVPPEYMTYFAAQAVDTSTGTVEVAPLPNFSHADTMFYCAQGLDASATVTVEVRTCVEYALAFTSPMMRFSEMAALKDQAALDRVQAIGRCLPSSRPTTAQSVTHGWLPEAAAWYGRTMGKIVGAVWNAGGRALEMVGGPARVAGIGLSALGSRLGQLSIAQPPGVLAISM
jgi:hypothetical protein